MNTPLAILASMRVLHWVKNLIIFYPLLFSKKLFQPDNLLHTALAFACFCIASSAVYILNDVFDRREDRLHPAKSRRPIASGTLSIPLALGAALVLLGISGYLANRLSPLLLACWACFVAINVLYSVVLKNIVIVDVLCIAASFACRVMAGAAAGAEGASGWLIICTLFLSLVLGFSKRRSERVRFPNAAETRRVLADYGLPFLDHALTLAVTGTLLSYFTYTLSPETIGFFGSRKMLLTTPFVLYGTLRYCFLVYQRNGGENPVRLILTDGPLLATVILWTAACGAVIYELP